MIASQVDIRPQGKHIILSKMKFFCPKAASWRSSSAQLKSLAFGTCFFPTLNRAAGSASMLAGLAGAAPPFTPMELKPAMVYISCSSSTLDWTDR